MPEELQTQIRAMIDRQRMAQTVTRQSITRFLQELTQDQLETFAFITSVVTDNPPSGAFYQGMARGILGQKFGVWAGWDDEPNLDVTANFDPESGHVEVDITPVPRETSEGDHPSWLKEVRDHTGEDRATDLADYNMSLSNEPPKVVCDGCGVVYQSLEDRMLRRPDECHGCIEKNKWG